MTSIRGKRIFITGGAGFIASAIIARLVRDNAIVVYDDFSRDSALSGGFRDDPNVTVVRGDVLDTELLTRSMAGAHYVVHAAAIAGIDTVIRDPVRTMRVNMIGTANVLESCRIHRIPDRVAVFSTSEVLGPMAYRSTEDDAAVVAGSAGEARWTYAASKLAGEHLSNAYFQTHGLPVVIVRPFNVYGPGQTGEGALHVFIRRALAGEDLHIDGDGNQIRAWCYVDDFVEGLLRCLWHPQAVGERFNIGNARAVITVLGLAQTICRVLESRSQIRFDPPLSADVQLRIPSVEKASTVLGFRSSIDLEEGIRRTAGWIKDSART
jgi:UDP-glucose 4-epimerase